MSKQSVARKAKKKSKKNLIIFEGQSLRLSHASAKVWGYKEFIRKCNNFWMLFCPQFPLERLRSKIGVNGCIWKEFERGNHELVKDLENLSSKIQDLRKAVSAARGNEASAKTLLKKQLELRAFILNPENDYYGKLWNSYKKLRKLGMSNARVRAPDARFYEKGELR